MLQPYPPLRQVPIGPGSEPAGGAQGAPLRILLLSDSRPGHYHLADGLVLAISRLRPVSIARLDVRQNPILRGRLARRGIVGMLPPAALLRTFYGLSPRELPPCDLVVSAGAETMAANIAAARLLDVPNFFLGSTRGLPKEHFSLVISSFPDGAPSPRHLVTLKPNHADPELLGRPVEVPTYGASHVPGKIALLIGGDSGLFRYAPGDGTALIAFLREMSLRHGVRWLVSNSRRTPAFLNEMLHGIARDRDVVEEFLDFQSAGPGTLPRLLARAEVVVCTEDSSSMISEAVTARYPVIGIAPAHHAFEPREAGYRAMLRERNLVRSCGIDALSPEQFLSLLEQVDVLPTFHVDTLAGELLARQPWLGEGPQSAAVMPGALHEET